MLGFCIRARVVAGSLSVEFGQSALVSVSLTSACGEDIAFFADCQINTYERDRRSECPFFD
jgi:hypothetical protein